MHTYLDFEKPIAELEGKIKELRHVSASGEEINIADEIGRLQNKVEKLLQNTYSKLTPWQKTLVARHPERPHTVNYIENLIEDFTRWPVIDYTAKIAPLSGAWVVLKVTALSSWAMKKATPPKPV